MATTPADLYEEMITKMSKKVKEKIPFLGLGLTVLLVVAAFVVWSNFFAKGASAVWFDDAFAFRQGVTVTVASSASDISNLETLLTINTSALISSKMQTNCADLRFTNVNGTPLKYYIDSGCNTTTTKVWVMADLVPKNTTTYTMYMYYGNPSAKAGSDPATFNLMNGLVGYWTMNEASWNGTSGEVKDSSVNGNNGTSSGGATTIAGQYGNAGSFSASKVVDMGNVLGFERTSPFSMSAWVKSASGAAYEIIMGKWDNDNTAEGYGSSISSSGIVSFHLAHTQTTNTIDVSGTTNIRDNNWHHVVETYDGSVSGAGVKIYVDGKQETTSVDNNNLTATTITADPFRIGNREATPSNLEFIGTIDDSRVYSRALSAAEVSQLYSNPGTIASNATTASRPTTTFLTEEKANGPVARWSFDEGTGTVAHDSTSQKNSGTLTNMSSTAATNSGWINEDLCVSGKCLGFDGENDYLSVADSAVLDLTGDLAISMWLKPGSTQVQYADILSKHSTGSNGYAIEQNSSNTNQYYFSWGNGSWICASTTLFTLTANTWQHLELSKSGTTVTAYVNGVSVGSCTGASSTIGNNSDSLNLGRWSSNGGRHWNGFIDEPKIYNYARTAAQVKADFDRGGAKGSSIGVLGDSTDALNKGLVGYWKMNEATWSGTAGEVKDASGNGNNGVEVNGATTAAGKFGNGGSFVAASSQYVDCTDVNCGGTSKLDGNGTSTTGWTVSAWFKLSSLGQSPGDLVGKSTNNGGIGYVLELSLGNKICMYFDNTGPCSNTSLTTGTWYHAVGVYNGSTVMVYLNGLLENKVSYSGGVTDTVADFVIGARHRPGVGYNGFFNGNIDESRIYNRALSPAEVRQLYNFAPGPTRYYKLDDATGTSAVDSSGNGGGAGTLNGGAKFVPGKYGQGVKLNGNGDFISVPDFTY